MAKCSRCNAQTVTCEVCGRTVREKGVSGVVPYDALPPGGPGGEPCLVPSHCLDFNHALIHSNSLDHSHSNKTTLDGYNQSNLDISDAITKKHSNTLDHSNSLDHNHANKALLDEYTGPIGGSGLTFGFSFSNGKLYYENFGELDIWIPDNKHLYMDVDTGELFVED
jgi:hypothetical protein